MQKNILITGGAGFIGSHISTELILQGYNVIIADNFSNSSKDVISRIAKITGTPINLYAIDVRDSKSLTEIFSQHDIYAVIHMAGLKAVGESSVIPIEYFSNNLSGTITLLETMKTANVKRLIFSSSATVYSTAQSPPYTENMPTDAINPYGRTKLFIEKMLQDVCTSDNSWSITSLRYFNPIGAHPSGLLGETVIGTPNNLMPYITQVALGELNYLNVFGNDYNTPDGTCQRDYIHIMDLADGHIGALNRLSKPGYFVCNLGTGKPVSVLEIISAFENATGVSVDYKITDRRVGDVAVSFADVTQAKQELNWVAKYSLEQMCTDSLNWQKRLSAGTIE